MMSLLVQGEYSKRVSIACLRLLHRGQPTLCKSYNGVVTTHTALTVSDPEGFNIYVECVHAFYLLLLVGHHLQQNSLKNTPFASSPSNI